MDLDTSVFVFGGGWSGQRTAKELASLGYEVTLVDSEPNLDQITDKTGFLAHAAPKQGELFKSAVQDISEIECMTGTSLLHFEGMPGRFRMKLMQGTDVVERRAGAVVVADDVQASPLFDAYGVSPSQRVVSQSQFEALAQGTGASDAIGSGKRVAFVVGFGQEGHPVVMRRVMQAVQKVQDQGGQAYVYVNNIKVAASGLERLYRDNRDSGAIYFKLQSPPQISPDGSSISALDPVLNQEVTLEPDLIVVEEALLASPEAPKLAHLLRIDRGPWDFMQENNVHRFPVRSNREGIFVVGGSRDVADLSLSWQDAANAAEEVHRFLGDGTALAPESKAVVDKEKCCFCLTCYRCCPHGAISWEDKPVISPLACQACGICASECPQDAIQIMGFEDQGITSQLDLSLSETAQAPSIVAFCCENSSLEALKMARLFGLNLPAGLKTIHVPCAGKVDLDYIFSAFLKGADGVLVLSCHPGNCKSVHGNTFAGWRVENVQRMLTNAGMDPSRLRFATLASNMGHDMTKILNELETTLKDLGPSPLK
ncbi:hydrogenase iron-sulfur subunit [Desulfovermiculus halophilus]|jgi:heterodisulfide reductase subunit A-like polyferredoxin/coenzyme F420-reducing hydrogenase delta subunit|uniref:hydrogenase iron-sulfur subunit n=1 Tax=Desulfovermiculus halophilus TaxID=339722 RepID=UPI0004818619|nr:hydrogenase iron-sulfur subunit [Desulfovermiculus halophilus]